MAHRLTRRDFLRRTAAGSVAFPLLTLPRLRGEPAPGDRLAMACIGVGGRGRGDMSAFLHDPRVRVVAVCDVDRRRAESAAGAVDKAYADKTKSGSYKGCRRTQDFREILAADDVDCIMIATPDHTHALIAVHAMRAGKDVYCEKPLAYSVAEGQAIVAAAETYGRILQTGTQRRSNSRIRHACELIRNGYIGEVKTVRVGLPRGFQIRQGPFAGNPPAQPVPEYFDYDKWLGPAPLAPYTPARCHFNFRWILAYGEGYISDWGAHYLDVAHWGIGADRSGPVGVTSEATFPEDGLYDAPTDFHLVYTYASGITVICSTRETLGMRFEGDAGWIHIEKPGSAQVVASSPKLLKQTIGPGEISLPASRNHHVNFIDCVLSRRETVAPPVVGHRSASVCHIGMISARLGRPLRWDPEAEIFPEDPAANRLLFRPMRAPWIL